MNSYETMCKGKHRHKSRRKAEAQMASLVANQRGKAEELHVYQCNKCMGFHIGHRLPPQQEEVVKSLAAEVELVRFLEKVKKRAR